LADSQFGFREGCSTIDAILRVKALSEEAKSQGGVALAVSLDIANAFNTLPWECIMGALKFHRVPPYLVAVIRDYFRDRKIRYTGRYAVQCSKKMERGVPQRSVLGPLLWDIEYNWVLRGDLPPGVDLVCYADDTLVVARGRDWSQAISTANIGTNLVVRRIGMLGLRVAVEKTEAMWLCQKDKRPPPNTSISINGVYVEVGSTLKYLGLTLDKTLSFRDYFAQMVPRIRKEVSNFGIIASIASEHRGTK